jgi:hypothetical protein
MPTPDARAIMKDAGDQIKHVTATRLRLLDTC